MPRAAEPASEAFSMVRLVPMSADAWRAWRVQSIRTYAAEKVRAGAWPAESAQQRAADDFVRILPDGQQTTGHDFRSIVTDAGEPVGVLWFAAEQEIGRGAIFIFDIVVDPQHRGQGFGRATMEALEPLARSLGYDRIRLHVFGHNAVARHLYGSVGYVETDVQMEKGLD